MPKKPDKPQDPNPPIENEVLRRMLTTPPEVQKKISKSKKVEK
jgi:hypothetical protein